jgi:hypothetical protein
MKSRSPPGAVPRHFIHLEITMIRTGILVDERGRMGSDVDGPYEWAVFPNGKGGFHAQKVKRRRT